MLSFRLRNLWYFIVDTLILSLTREYRILELSSLGYTTGNHVGGQVWNLIHMAKGEDKQKASQQEPMISSEIDDFCTDEGP
jgi:hypothetical protein